MILCTLHSDASFMDLDCDSSSQECEKAVTSSPSISQSFQSIWKEFGTLFRLVGVMNLIVSFSFNAQGR